MHKQGLAQGLEILNSFCRVVQLQEKEQGVPPLTLL